jgi:hypothetical protein
MNNIATLILGIACVAAFCGSLARWIARRASHRAMGKMGGTLCAVGFCDTQMILPDQPPRNGRIASLLQSTRFARLERYAALYAMSSKAIFTALGFGLILAGCSSVQIQPPSGKSAAARVFTDYHAAFRFIAERERLPMDAGTLFRLAADSEIQVWCFDDIPPLYVITARYYAGGIYDQIRGAQGQGRYYLLRTFARDFTAVGNIDRSFELVGVAEGNSYTWQTINHQLRLITRWHLSAAESSTNAYDWDGRAFNSVSAAPR